jgi:hypothetical protein
MGGASLILIWIAKGSVAFLVVLYSINVFLTFSLSQLGMITYWFKNRGEEKNGYKGSLSTVLDSY